jgi:hypothetical protein
MSDMIYRLRARDCAPYCVVLSGEAADELSRLAAENAALRGLLQGYIDDYMSEDGMFPEKYYAKMFHAALTKETEK